MDRSTALDHLALTRRHIRTGGYVVARQREHIAWLERQGNDTRQARDLLAQHLELLALHIADRDRLIETLA
jgi:hypothetical protein